MDIKCKILIVDDDILDEDDVTFQSIKLEVEKLYLIPKIVLSNGSDYKQKIKLEDYDLYLIDYSLVKDVYGHQVIKEIRDTNKSLTDIVLYSTTGENLYQKISEYDLDGVYICTRSDLKIKVERILKKQEKRSQNPLSLRGIVLHNYSDVEFRLREQLLKIYDKQGGDQRSQIVSIVEGLIESGSNSYNKKIEECKNGGDFVEKLFSNKNYLFDMGKKIELLDYLRKNHYIQIKQDDISLLKSLNKDRNDLGHSKIYIEDNEMVAMDINKDKITYNQDKCNEIKRKLIRAKEILDKLEQQN